MYPECFEDTTLGILHTAFLEAARIMQEIGPDGKNYWDILKASQELLEAMGHIENAAFDWRSYSERLDLFGEKEQKEERQEEAKKKEEKSSPILQEDGTCYLCPTCSKLDHFRFPDDIRVVSPEMEKMVYTLHKHLSFCRCYQK